MYDITQFKNECFQMFIPDNQFKAYLLVINSNFITEVVVNYQASIFNLF